MIVLFSAVGGLLTVDFFPPQRLTARKRILKIPAAIETETANAPVSTRIQTETKIRTRTETQTIAKATMTTKVVAEESGAAEEEINF